MMLSILFKDTPDSWGLRGDPFLWDELKKEALTINFPISEEELNETLHKLFELIIGKSPEKGKIIYIERYNSGGMSGGQVNCDFWLDKAFPLIIERYKAQRII